MERVAVIITPYRVRSKEVFGGPTPPMLQPAPYPSLVGLALSNLLHNPVGVTTVRAQLAVLVKHCRVGVRVSRTSVDNTLPLRTVTVHPAPVTSLVHLELVLIQEKHGVPRAVKVRHNRDV